jgi:hypothetical protein
MTWIMPISTTNSSISWAFPWTVAVVASECLGAASASRAPWSSLLRKEKSFKWVKSFMSLSLGWVGIEPIPEMPSSHLFYCTSAK